MKNDTALLTIKDVCAIANVTSMTVYNWRHATRTDKAKLPTVRVTAGSKGKRRQVAGVRFNHETFLKWAKANDVKVDSRVLTRRLRAVTGGK